jgi:hypothetical protein
MNLPPIQQQLSGYSGQVPFDLLSASSVKTYPCTLVASSVEKVFRSLRDETLKYDLERSQEVTDVLLFEADWRKRCDRNLAEYGV